MKLPTLSIHKELTVQALRMIGKPNSKKALCTFCNSATTRSITFLIAASLSLLNEYLTSFRGAFPNQLTESTHKLSTCRPSIVLKSSLSDSGAPFSGFLNLLKAKNSPFHPPSGRKRSNQSENPVGSASTRTLNCKKYLEKWLPIDQLRYANTTLCFFQ